MLAFCPAPVVFHSVPSGTTWKPLGNHLEPSGIDRNHSELIGTCSEVLGTDQFHSVPLGTCGAQKSTADTGHVALTSALKGNSHIYILYLCIILT